jgi:hypothetical protein
VYGSHLGRPRGKVAREVCEGVRSLEPHALFFEAAIVAGAINALAGGGLITFPLLALVVPPVTAGVMSALALLPAHRPPCGVHGISQAGSLVDGCGYCSSPACWAAW